jgi:hypothetical protein
MTSKRLHILSTPIVAKLPPVKFSLAMLSKAEASDYSPKKMIVFNSDD